MLLVASPAAAEQVGLTLQEEQGRRIYVRGEGIDGREITAVLGGGGVEVPATTMPCATCHGADGKGRAEGGLSPSDITWPALTRPYASSTPSGRRPGAYDDDLLERAVTLGIDSAGQTLHVAMPRYRLSHGEAAALVAYLRRLSEIRQPGVEEDRLRLGVMLPPAGPLSSLGRAIRSVLAAAADQVNDAGGLYARRLELRFFEPTEPRHDALARFLEDEEIFAFVASYLVAAEAEVTEILGRYRVPVVGPFAIYPQTDLPGGAQVFYLAAGLPRQAEALVDFAVLRTTATTRRAAIIHPAPAEGQAVVEAIRERGVRHGGPWATLEALAYPPGRSEDLAGLAAKALEDGVDTVFFLGTESETETFFQAVEELGWRPRILLLGELAGAGAFAAPKSLHDRIFLAVPTLAADVRPRGFAKVRKLRARARLPADHLADQVAALAAFELLVEAVERAGRRLDRDRLIAALEGLVELDVGLTPPLTYGPNRRIGALGAYVVTPDFERRRLPASGEWMPLGE